MSGITVRSAYGKLQKTLIDKDLRDQFYVTGQAIGSNRRGLDVIPMGFFELSTDVIEAGSDDNLVNLTAHGAKVGDILKINTSANSINETQVVIDEIIDANSFRLGAVLSANLALGDTVSILRPIMPQYDSSGALVVYSSNYNYNFLLDGVETQVTEDTAVPANNRPLPVKLMGVNGTLSLTANNLDISSDHTEDSISLGDGVTLAEIKPVTRELKVSDADALAQLILLVAKDFATGAKQDTGNTSLSSIDGKLTTLNDKDFATQTTLAALLTELQLKADLSETQPVSAASLPLPTGASTSANQSTIITALASLLTELQLKADLSETQPVSAASLPLPTGAATEAKQDTGITALGTINTTLGSTNTKLDSLETALTPELYSHQTQSVTGSTTFTKPANARRMIVQNSLESLAPIRFVAAADTPTSSSGFYLGIGQSTSEMAAGSFKAISTDGSAADVTVLWSV